jgi:hypothetical protein
MVMVACLQNWNMFLDLVLTRLFTNQVVFDGIKFSFDLIQKYNGMSNTKITS